MKILQHQIPSDSRWQKRTEGTARPFHYAFIKQTLKKKWVSNIVQHFYHFWWQWRHPSSAQSAPTSVNATHPTATSIQIHPGLSPAPSMQPFWVDSRILAWNFARSLCTKFSLKASYAEFAFWCEAERRLETLTKDSKQRHYIICTMTNKYTINWQIIILLHVSPLFCHPQGACNQYLAKLHMYFKCNCW